MLSSAAEGLPGGDGWLFEPKWDGFRTLVFRDGDDILLQSRDEKPMNRYFPELLEPLARALPERCVVDGEVVIVGARDHAEVWAPSRWDDVRRSLEDPETLAGHLEGLGI